MCVCVCACVTVCVTVCACTCMRLHGNTTMAGCMYIVQMYMGRGVACARGPLCAPAGGEDHASALEQPPDLARVEEALAFAAHTRVGFQGVPEEGHSCADMGLDSECAAARPRRIT